MHLYFSFAVGFVQSKSGTFLKTNRSTKLEALFFISIIGPAGPIASGLLPNFELEGCIKYHF